MREGLSAAAADRYCGALQQQIEGGSSSQEFGSAPNPQMSEQMQQKQKEDGGEGNVTLTMQEAEALANAVFNNDIEKAKKILSSVMNIQEETGPAPPQA